MIRLQQSGYLTEVYKNGEYIGRVYEGNGKYYTSRPRMLEEVEFKWIKSAIKYLLLVEEDERSESS